MIKRNAQIKTNYFEGFTDEWILQEDEYNGVRGREVKEFIVEIPLDKCKNQLRNWENGKDFSKDLKNFGENLQPTVTSNLFNVYYWVELWCIFSGVFQN